MKDFVKLIFWKGFSVVGFLNVKIELFLIMENFIDLNLGK